MAEAVVLPPAKNIDLNLFDHRIGLTPHRGVIANDVEKFLFERLATLDLTKTKFDISQIGSNFIIDVKTIAANGEEKPLFKLVGEPIGDPMQAMRGEIRIARVILLDAVLALSHNVPFAVHDSKIILFQRAGRLGFSVFLSSHLAATFVNGMSLSSLQATNGLGIGLERSFSSSRVKAGLKIQAEAGVLMPAKPESSAKLAPATHFFTDVFIRY